jgi:hypothetical protein
MADQNNPSPDVPSAVKRVILASAPEKEQDLQNIWDEYSIAFSLASDQRGFFFESGAFGMVLFTSRSMSYMWLLGFAAQEALKDYCGVTIGSVIYGRFDPAYFDYVPESKFGDLISLISSISIIESEDNFLWPEGIPHPKFGKPKDLSGSMVFDLLCMSAAYSFLHEVEHVRIAQDGRKLTPHAEELRCDEFAREMLLNGIAEYSKTSGYQEETVTTKRAISISLASFFLLAITPEDAWGGTRSHPPIADRINALTNSLLLPDNDHFWTYLSCLLIAQLHIKGEPIEPFHVKSTKQFAQTLLQKFPRELIARE